MCCPEGKTVVPIAALLTALVDVEVKPDSAGRVSNLTYTDTIVLKRVFQPSRVFFSIWQ